MTSPEMKKALAATRAIKKSEPIVQEGEQTMSSLSEATVNGQSNKFDTTISVAGCHVETATLAGGNQPDELVAILTMPDRTFAFTPETACALAAALQAVAVHLMEQGGER